MYQTFSWNLSTIPTHILEKMAHHIISVKVKEIDYTTIEVKIAIHQRTEVEL